jgi:quercetin dioxygenase-like cupin family protein
MPTPVVTKGESLTVIEALRKYAPEQGGIEYQTDQPGKAHRWHSHSVTETLVVLEGSMILEWAETVPENVVGRTTVCAGDVIHLPAHTIHQSLNQNGICHYLILTEDGTAAKTRVY